MKVFVHEGAWRRGWASSQVLLCGERILGKNIQKKEEMEIVKTFSQNIGGAKQ